jgi:hypothetical protein
VIGQFLGWQDGRGEEHFAGQTTMCLFPSGGLACWVRYAGFQAVIRRCSFSRLWVVHTSAHSPRTFSTPRSRNCRKPRACLICPKTGSTIVLRPA